MFVEDWNMAFVGRLKLFRQDILHVILATRVVYYGANGHVIFGGGGDISCARDTTCAQEMCGHHNLFNKKTCVS